MKSRDLRLVPVALAVWAAALVCVFQPGLAAACALVCGVAAGVVLLVLLARGRHGAGLVLLMLAAAAATALSVGYALPSREAAAGQGGRVVEAVVEVTSSASTGQDGRLWVEATTQSLGPPGRARPVAVPVRIGTATADGIDLGARLRVVGETSATEAGERAVLVLYATTTEVVQPTSGVFGVAATARRAFVDRALRLPEPGGALLPGLAVGDTRAVGSDLDEDMRSSGLSHLTAVSGANCAIVVAAVFGLTALCGGGRALRVVLAATALSGFVVLVTPEPSVVRAAVMAGAGMLSVLLGRPSAGAGVLALSTIMILVSDPWLAATPGFALSAVATGALILLAPPLSRGLRRWMPGPVALAIAVPLSAQLACGPIIALFAEQQSLIGVAANLIAEPAAPVATVVGLLACLAGPVPAVADLLAATAWLPATWIATTAQVTADLPGATILLPAGIGSAALVAGLGAAVAVVCLEGGSRGPRWRVRGGAVLRGGAVTVLVVAGSLAGAQALLGGPLATAATPDAWSIAACDVGQGDALLVRSEGAVALIDTGPAPEPLRDCLRSLGIDRLDLLVLTHFDLDHAGGVEAVRGRVSAVLHGPTADADDERTLASLAAGGAQVEQASAGLRGTLGGATWRVRWPVRDTTAFPAGNDLGVVMEFSGGEVPRSLFLADLSAPAQRLLQRSERLGPYAVVKVAHHGSADQDPGLYQALSPVVALISVGADNDYGHPRRETLDLLGALGAQVYRTDERGRILLGLRHGALAMWSETTPERRGRRRGSGTSCRSAPNQRQRSSDRGVGRRR
ncbi:ComEC/Rec2 family competence protein [Microbacterium sufflavum]|uniref:ComEC/Rec2 family competence protein n=1 Tax=Microbacterium sufflavum TaxID=2851649 RepID=A0ABY4IJA1_9MICO|nr:ComEC/Rec2 family competence protein [Microbacterium sufflavum]UPL12340.1 ComEC/Rec2 family competence protein [Microbacterium sufflavum]